MQNAFAYDMHFHAMRSGTRYALARDTDQRWICAGAQYVLPCDMQQRAICANVGYVLVQDMRRCGICASVCGICQRGTCTGVGYGRHAICTFPRYTQAFNMHRHSIALSLDICWCSLYASVRNAPAIDK